MQKSCNLSSSAFLVAEYIATFEISQISFQKMKKKHENSVISRDFFAIFQNKNNKKLATFSLVTTCSSTFVKMLWPT
jgi:hypothetical protein